MILTLASGVPAARAQSGFSPAPNACFDFAGRFGEPATNQPVVPGVSTYPSGTEILMRVYVNTADRTRTVFDRPTGRIVRYEYPGRSSSFEVVINRNEFRSPWYVTPLDSTANVQVDVFPDSPFYIARTAESDLLSHPVGSSPLFITSPAIHVSMKASSEEAFQPADCEIQGCYFSLRMGNRSLPPPYSTVAMGGAIRAIRPCSTGPGANLRIIRVISDQRLDQPHNFLPGGAGASSRPFANGGVNPAQNAMLVGIRSDDRAYLRAQVDLSGVSARDRGNVLVGLRPIGSAGATVLETGVPNNEGVVRFRTEPLTGLIDWPPTLGTLQETPRRLDQFHVFEVVAGIDGGGSASLLPNRRLEPDEVLTTGSDAHGPWRIAVATRAMWVKNLAAFLFGSNAVFAPNLVLRDGFCAGTAIADVAGHFVDQQTPGLFREAQATRISVDVNERLGFAGGFEVPGFYPAGAPLTTQVSIKHFVYGKDSRQSRYVRNSTYLANVITNTLNRNADSIRARLRSVDPTAPLEFPLVIGDAKATYVWDPCLRLSVGGNSALCSLDLGPQKCARLRVAFRSPVGGYAMIRSAEIVGSLYDIWDWDILGLFSPMQANFSTVGFPAGEVVSTEHVLDGEVNVPLESWVWGVAPPVRPQLSARGLVHGASFASGPVAPGQIIALFGAEFAPPGLTQGTPNDSGVFPTVLSGTRVLIEGEATALIFVSPGQLSAVVPKEVAGKSQIGIAVERNGVVSPEVRVAVANAAPGLFTQNSAGSGPAAAINQDGTLNSASNPAVVGSVISVWGTGFGVPDGPFLPGTTRNTAPTVSVNPRAEIGGEPATVMFAGYAPGILGAAGQWNIQVPAISPGARALRVGVGGQWSQPGVTVHVK